MHCFRWSKTYHRQSKTQVGEITQEKRSVHVQHGRHCLLVSPDVEGVTVLLTGLNVVMGLCPSETVLQHSADCDVVARSEQQTTTHNNHDDHIIHSCDEKICSHNINSN